MRSLETHDQFRVVRCRCVCSSSCSHSCGSEQLGRKNDEAQKESKPNLRASSLRLGANFAIKVIQRISNQISFFLS